jgi:hypothetical protein
VDGSAVQVQYMRCTIVKFMTYIYYLRYPVVLSPVLQLVIFTGMARGGVKIPQDGNRANTHGHVAAVHRHVWRTLCSVCATGARVAHPVPCNS